MGVALHDIVRHLDATLEIDRFRGAADYCTNGLQVEGADIVSRVATGVSASAEMLERARDHGADLVVVHHGLFWGAGLRSLTGLTGRRIRHLAKHDTSLAAYHLPLDLHPALGNNAGLADAMGLPMTRSAFGDVKGHLLGVAVDLPQPFRRKDLIDRVKEGVLGGAVPQFVFPFGPEEVTRVGLCTGAASDLIEAAASAGCQFYVTGELAERAGEMARELGVTLVAAGHYATEVFGPRRLADEIVRAFPTVTAQFIDVPSPL